MRINRSTLANVTNGTDDTYYYYFSGAGYDLSYIHAVIGAGSGSVTVTLEGTMSDAADATAAALLTDYVDITSAVLGSANFTATFLKSCSNLLAPLTWARLKVVANTGGANDGDWKLKIARFKGEL